MTKEKDNREHFEAWTDGSADNKNPVRPGGAAYIILDINGDVVAKRSKGFIGTTNNRMELLAIISVVNALPYGASVTIHTDSQYCITALGSEHPLKNLDQIALYHKLVNDHRLKVRFRWIKGHNGFKYNEECDKMARMEYAKMLLKEPKAEKPTKVPNHVEEAYYSCITTKDRRKRVKKK